VFDLSLSAFLLLLRVVVPAGILLVAMGKAVGKAVQKAMGKAVGKAVGNSEENKRAVQP
jgi:hypothetical protein